MANLVDLTNKRFGKWTVLGRGTGTGKQIYWRCLCECGNEVSVGGGPLANGRSKGCRNCCKWRGIGEFSKDHFSQIKRGAVERNIEFSLTMEELWSQFLVQNRSCPLSGLVLKMGRNKSLRTASLDRKSSSLGYIKGNVWWVHKRLNIMKQELSTDDFVLLCNMVANVNPMKIQDSSGLRNIDNIKRKSRGSTKFFAFGVHKTLRSWLEDDRCTCKTTATLLYRLKQGMSLQDAIITPLYDQMRTLKQ